MTEAVLFDLDGTFADTAPDLNHALNQMRAARGLAPVPLETTRPVTSLGARGLLRIGFSLSPGDPTYNELRAEFLRRYEADICLNTRLFPGTEELLAGIEARGIRWGIVTNKAEHLARLLLRGLNMETRSACVIGGDTTPHLKPHPAPLLAASTTLAVAPQSCIYVGDDQRDIAAGRAAGMRTVAVGYGYLNGSEPATWGADALIARPEDLLPLLPIENKI